MNNADGATPNLLLRIPKLAEIKAKGIMIFSMSSAPCENGSKIGIRRETLSRLKDETEATFPVLKNADWSNVRKNNEVRASDKVRERNGEEERAGGTTGLPFVSSMEGFFDLNIYTLCSRPTHVISVTEKAR